MANDRGATPRARMGIGGGSGKMISTGRLRGLLVIVALTVVACADREMAAESSAPAMTEATAVAPPAAAASTAADPVAQPAASATEANPVAQPGERSEQPCCPCPNGARVLDKKLIGLLSMARAYHHQADVHLGGGARANAVAAVRKIVALDLSSRWPEAEEARLDATARLAKLLLADGDLDGAQATVDRGIAGATRESFYAANLHGVHGEVLEARVAQLKSAKNAKGAKKAARAAIAAFERSIAINKALQKRLDDARSKR